MTNFYKHCPQCGSDNIRNSYSYCHFGIYCASCGEGITASNAKEAMEIWDKSTRSVAT